MANNTQWWKTVADQYFWADVLNKINLSKDNSSVDKCRILFEAINQTFNKFHIIQASTGRQPETVKFINLVLAGLTETCKTSLCNSIHLKSLAEFTPQIMDHQTLLENQYNPLNIPGWLVQRAQRKHQALLDSYIQYTNTKDDGTKAALIESAARLLYMVRSNIAHGEKTPRGPDMEKYKRDKAVCDVTYPLLELFFELLFDKPSTRLAVYGTLAPGQPNHSVLEKYGGKWLHGFVIGKLSDRNNLKFFYWNTSGDEIAVQVIESSRLAEGWQDIDRFEGHGYERILIPVRFDSIYIPCYIYEGREPYTTA